MNGGLCLLIRLREVGHELLREKFPFSQNNVRKARIGENSKIHHSSCIGRPAIESGKALGIRCISLVNQHEVHEAIVSDDGNALRNESIDDSREPSEARQQGGLQPRLVTFIA